MSKKYKILIVMLSLQVFFANSYADVIIESATTNYNWLTWSADGKRLAYRSGLDIWTINIDGSDKIQITNMPSERSAWGVTYRPETEYLYYCDNSPSSSTLWWYLKTTFDGSIGRNTVVQVPGGEGYSPPSFSADGSRYCFVHYKRPSYAELKIADADGNNVQLILKDDNIVKGRYITTAEAYWGKGSCSNTLFYCSTIDEESKIRSIYKIDLDGNNKEILTDQKLGWCVLSDISPDGKHLVFYSDNKIFFTNIETKETDLILDDGKNNVNAKFSPDGKRLAYFSYNETDYDIIITESSFAENSKSVNGKIITNSTILGYTAAVGGATIKATEYGITSTTNIYGEFQLLNVPIGKCILEIESSYFQTLTKSIQVTYGINNISDIEIFKPKCQTMYTQQEVDTLLDQISADKNEIISEKEKTITQLTESIASMYTQGYLDSAILEAEIRGELKYDINGDGKVGLEEVIKYLETLSGVRVESLIIFPGNKKHFLSE
jgi:Tol biopolymer transport system component